MTTCSRVFWGRRSSEGCYGKAVSVLQRKDGEETSEHSGTTAPRFQTASGFMLCSHSSAERPGEQSHKSNMIMPLATTKRVARFRYQQSYVEKAEGGPAFDIPISSRPKPMFLDALRGFGPTKSCKALNSEYLVS